MERWTMVEGGRWTMGEGGSVVKRTCQLFKNKNSEPITMTHMWLELGGGINPPLEGINDGINPYLEDIKRGINPLLPTLEDIKGGVILNKPDGILPLLGGPGGDLSPPTVVPGPQGADPSIFVLEQPPGGPPGPISYTLTRQGPLLQIVAQVATGGQTTTQFRLSPAQADCRTVLLYVPGAAPLVFAVGAPLCFQQGSRILTPEGYRAIETLKPGDPLCTHGGEVVPLQRLLSFTETGENCPLYCLPAGSLAENLPLQDLFMSANHAFRFAGTWQRMKTAAAAHRTGKQVIQYYHIVVADYFRWTVVAEGVEVETCGVGLHVGVTPPLPPLGVNRGEIFPN